MYKGRTLAIAVAMFAAAGCGTPDDPSANNGNNGATNNGATNNGATNNGATNNGATNNGATNNGATNNGATNNGATNNGATNNGTQVGPFATCDEGMLTACFSNTDCAAGERCQDVGDGIEVPCCVTGSRGAKAVGEQCASETECESGVCIGRNDSPEICSMECPNGDECPDTLECVMIPFTGGSGMWCVTPSV